MTRLELFYRRLNVWLRPLGLPYALLMRKRRELYRRGALRSYAPHCPCVSVGNIAFGGSGKTPLVSLLLEDAIRRGKRAVVLSRGYGAQPGKKPVLVKPDTPVERAGDEPLMLARRFPEAAVLVCPRRAEAARYAEQYLSPDLLILDDGMQHLAVRRSADLVLLRPDDLDADWNRVIPSGPWREDASALSAATAFLLKASPEECATLAPLIRERLEPFGKPLFSFRLAPTGLRRLFPENGKEGEALAPEEYADSPYILVSGVGNPAGVEATATELMGRKPLQHFDFADHHPYSSLDVQALCKMTAAPLPVVCTAKDAVKLGAFAGEFGGAKVWVLETRPEFGPALFTDESFESWRGSRMQIFS